jgi:hypothetical protein
MEVRYCFDDDCQHAHCNKTPAAESHKQGAVPSHLRPGEQGEDAPGGDVMTEVLVTLSVSVLGFIYIYISENTVYILS